MTAGPPSQRAHRPDAASARAGARGQATVEVVAFLPLAALAGAVLIQVLAAGAAAEYADHAAAAGAIALLQDRDPEDAARDAIPSWSRGRLRVRTTGRTVHVTLTPKSIVPGAASLLEATAEADAGPREGA